MDKMTPEYKNTQPWWRVSQSYFDSHKLTEHQLDSYNIFMREKLPIIISTSEFEYTKEGVHYVVTFDNVYIKKPEFTEPSGITCKLKPQDCRIRNLNYMCKIFVDINRVTVQPDGKIDEKKTFSEVYIGSIPCMVLSEYCNLHNKTKTGLIKNGECPKDPGGYFIINGQEKVLMSQDRMAHNEIFVFKSKDKDSIKLNATSNDNKNYTVPCGWSAEIRSYSPFYEPNITSTYVKLSEEQLEKGEDARLYIELPGLKAPVAWPIIFMALGVTDTDEMAKLVCDPNDTEMINMLKPSLETPFIKTQQDALDYLVDYVTTLQKDSRLIILRKILCEKMFQNIPEANMKKFYLGHMTHQLLATALGRRHEDDRDHYGKKRVETAGSLINNLFKSIWKRIIREIVNNLIKKRTGDMSQVFYGKITNYIRPPFASGNWTATKMNAKAAKAGISQLLNRHNFVSTVSNLRRVITPSDKNSKIIKPRHLHDSQWCYLCPVETPEGPGCGLIRNLAMFSIITLGSSENQVINMMELDTKTMSVTSRSTDSGGCKVFLNGNWVGVTRTPNELVDRLRNLRRNGKLAFDTSISHNHDGVRVYTDEGRIIAPFFIINNGKLPDLPEDFTWSSLLENGVIEYLDFTELETLYHGVYPWQLDPMHTHCMIHPALQLGVSASTAPFPDHNQSPRNIYQAAMGKQALGVFSLNYLYRYDTNAHILCYPQIPLVNTQTMRQMGSDELPSGQNLIVAVMSGAYNQEDSVMINQRALDNGALRSMCYTTYSESYHRKGNTVDEIRRPEKTKVKETRVKGYSKLDADGVSKENTPICKRDVVIGKVNTTHDSVRDISAVVKTNGLDEDAILQTDDSYTVGFTGTGVIDRAILTINEDSYRTAKVRVRQMRVPQIGDKVASRSAQKGIIGMILQPENMPFAEATGMTPDLLMNPNAFPSRMTVGQALETLLGKACALNGSLADCTPFEPDFNRKAVAEELAKYGFEEYGDEIMINGITGERMPVKLFMGPTYYQRLKHMVDDKIHSRDQDGPRETLTRQPVEGRKRGGGFRMGEMETWCGISHGVSSFLIDRLVNNSDGYEMYVCNYCGNIAIVTLSTKRFECKRCQQDTAISKIRVPYALKLLVQELQACGIGVWFNIDNTKKLVAGPTPSH